MWYGTPGEAEAPHLLSGELAKTRSGMRCASTGGTMR
jgi:hypothetical protein